MLKTQIRLAITFILLTSLNLTGCQTTSVQAEKTVIANNLITAYDYQLLNTQWQTITLKQLTQELSKTDVIFIGEYHGNHASHLLQTQLFTLMHQQHPKLVLSMEMFNRDQQAKLNEYLDGIIGEQTLIDQAPAWNNYKASYRPSIEFAKQNQLPVIAANASAELIRCIGTQGKNYLTKLNSEEKQWLAQKPFAEIANYRSEFFKLMGQAKHAKGSKTLNNMYLAQITRDNTMAESITKALKQNPNHKVIHLNGNFHSKNHLGTAGALERLNPQLNIKVITPIDVNDLPQLSTPQNRTDNYYYVVKPQPTDYVQEKNRNKAYKTMFEKSQQKAKTCK